MKKLFLFVAVVISAISAIASDQFYVIMKDGSVESYPTDKVDSISFDDPQIANAKGFNDLMSEIEKLKKEIDLLKSNQGNNGGASSSVDMKGALSTLWFQTIYAKDMSAIGITTDTVVDLGLSVKWANFNVGASACYEYGDYFQWGETHTTDNYVKDSCKAYGKDEATLLSEGVIDTTGNLNPAYDVATQNWGPNYRMPSLYEYEELLENCIWTWLRVLVSSDNMVSGYYVKSKINGNAIFLPAAGDRSDTSSYGMGSEGDYWSSTVDESKSYYAHYFSNNVHYLYFDSSSKRTNYVSGPSSGRSVRPVTE